MDQSATIMSEMKPTHVNSIAVATTTVTPAFCEFDAGLFSSSRSLSVALCFNLKLMTQLH